MVSILLLKTANLFFLSVASKFELKCKCLTGPAHVHTGVWWRDGAFSPKLQFQLANLLSLFINYVVDLRWAWRITEYLSNYLTEAYKIIAFVKHLRFPSHHRCNLKPLKGWMGWTQTQCARLGQMCQSSLVWIGNPVHSVTTLKGVSEKPLSGLWFHADLLLHGSCCFSLGGWVAGIIKFMSPASKGGMRSMTKWGGKPG